MFSYVFRECRRPVSRINEKASLFLRRQPRKTIYNSIFSANFSINSNTLLKMAERAWEDLTPSSLSQNDNDLWKFRRLIKTKMSIYSDKRGKIKIWFKTQNNMVPTLLSPISPLQLISSFHFLPSHPPSPAPPLYSLSMYNKFTEGIVLYHSE